MKSALNKLQNDFLTASQKDSGLTPAQLAWVLNQIKLGDDLIPPGNVTVTELREYLKELIVRLTNISFPE